MTRRRRRIITGSATGVITAECIMCQGSGLDHYSREPDVIDCQYCQGSGHQVISRLEAWSRPKRYIGTRQPGANSDGYEKWPRYGTEVPPEIAALLDAAQRRALRDSFQEPNRAALVRTALREWLERHDPEQPVVDATVDEDPEIKELNEAVVEATADEDPEPQVKQLKQGYHPR